MEQNINGLELTAAPDQAETSNKIYLDNAATTAVRPEVVNTMLPYFNECYGNPSAIYEFATKNRKEVNKARGKIAEVLNCDMREVYFTSGGTESDNWALIGAAEAAEAKGRHIITTKIEHHAVLHTCEYLKKRGFEITYLPVGKDGIVDPAELISAIRRDTVLVSVMMANNEIGTLQPVKELCGIAHDYGALFHTDAVQAFGQLPVDVRDLGVDLLSASAHKLYGPKGIGMLYIRDGVRLNSLMHGGAQERHRRAGTENVPGIVGFGAAAELAAEEMQETMQRETRLRDYLIGRILNEIPNASLNGHSTLRLPGNANFCFCFTEGESLLILLDMKGICASSGSACTTGSQDPSHVLTAIGLPEDRARGSLRMTLSRSTTKEELDYTVDRLAEIVEKVRAMRG